MKSWRQKAKQRKAKRDNEKKADGMF